MPTLQRAATALADVPGEDVLRWGSMATVASSLVWDIDGMLATAEREVQLARDAGALALLPGVLHVAGLARASIGDFAGAASALAEAESVSAATGNRLRPYTLLRVRALQGREEEATALIASAIEHAESEMQAIVATHALWAAAVLYNGLGRYEEAASAAGQATSNRLEPMVSKWVLPELVEAAARMSDDALARDAFERLAESKEAAGNDVALGLGARCEALLREGATAESLYLEAIDRLGRTPLRPMLARAYLLYGEWLRREGRRIDARE